MTNLRILRSEIHSKIKINLGRGDLSSDAVLLLIKEFINKIGLDKLIYQYFQTNDKTVRINKDAQILLQKIHEQLAGYFTDDDLDESTADPICTNMLDKDSLASQTNHVTLFNLMDDNTLMQRNWILYLLWKKIYAIKNQKLFCCTLIPPCLIPLANRKWRASIIITRIMDIIPCLL